MRQNRGDQIGRHTQPHHDEGEQQEFHKASSASTDKPLALCFLPMERRVKKEGEKHEPEP